MHEYIDGQGIEADDTKELAPFLEPGNVDDQVQHGHEHSANTSAAEYESGSPDTFDDGQGYELPGCQQRYACAQHGKSSPDRIGHIQEEAPGSIAEQTEGCG